MSTKALTGLVAEWFTPTNQRGDEVEDPTRYKIKPLDGLQFLEVASHGKVLANGDFLPDHTGRLLLLRHGLKDWENLLDHAGEPLAFNLARIKFVPVDHLGEIASEILQLSALGAEDRKN